MKVTIVPIVIGALGTVTKGLLKGLEDLEIGGWVETIQTTTLLRTARILRRVLETWGDSNASEKPPANIDVKNSRGIIIIITKLENARPWSNTWFLVQEVHLNSRQTSIRNEQMPTNSARTRVDD